MDSNASSAALPQMPIANLLSVAKRGLVTGWWRLGASAAVGLLTAGCGSGPDNPENVGQVASALDWVNVVGRITADGAQALAAPNPTQTYHGDLWEDGRPYHIVEMGPFEDLGNLDWRHLSMFNLVQKSSLACPRSADHACLQFLGYESNYPGHNDRIEVEVSSPDHAGALVLGEWRYLRFDLVIDQSSADPSQDGPDILVSQVWQNHDGSAADNWKPPALSVALKRASDLSIFLEFRACTDELYSINPDAVRCFTYLTAPVTPGVWTRFFIAMKPHYWSRPTIDGQNHVVRPPPGAVIVWRDKPLDWVPIVNADNLPLNETTDFFWGYRPRYVSTHNFVSNAFTTRVGIYRNGGNAKRVSFKLDNIKFTTDENNLPGP